MKSKILPAVTWFVCGMLFMGIIVWFTLPSLMFIEHKSPYNYEKTIQVLDQIIAEEKGWKVSKSFDFNKNIQQAGFSANSQLGSIALCHPEYASRILESFENRKVTAIMPLCFGIYSDSENSAYISELNVGMLGMMFGGTIADVMSEAGNDTERIMNLVTSQE